MSCWFRDLHLVTGTLYLMLTFNGHLVLNCSTVLIFARSAKKLCKVFFDSQREGERERGVDFDSFSKWWEKLFFSFFSDI